MNFFILMLSLRSLGPESNNALNFKKANAKDPKKTFLQYFFYYAFLSLISTQTQEIPKLISKLCHLSFKQIESIMI